MTVEYIYEDMYENVDNEVFIEDMEAFPGYAICSDGRVENTMTGRILKPGKNNKGYYFVSIKNQSGKVKCVKIHKLVAKYFIKNPQNKPCVDHIDRNHLNNDYRNLRYATIQENCRNRSKQSNNTSGHVGVTWHKKAKKWCVHIKVDGKQLHIGYYPKLEDAIKARAEQVELHFSEFANE